MMKHRYRLKDKGVGCFYVRKKKPYATLEQLFAIMQPAELRRQIENCKEKALCNTEGFYEKGEERQRLLLFCEQILKLSDALYILYIARLKRKTGESIDSGATPIIYPRAVIVGFFLQFSPAYARTELFDLLEAAVGHEGSTGSRSSQLILTYRLMSGLLETAMVFFDRN